MNRIIQRLAALVLGAPLLLGMALASAATTGPKAAPIPLPIEVLGATLRLDQVHDRAGSKAFFAGVTQDAPSLDQPERLQYDLVLVPEEGPVSFVFDFDDTGELAGLTIDAYQKSANPTVTTLLDWLETHVGPPLKPTAERWRWTLGGWEIEHRFGGDGEDSTYSLSLTPTRRVTLDAKARRALDTFFSNFSEAGVGSFDEQTLADPQLREFALAHLYLNRFKDLKPSPDGMTVEVTAAQVDQATERYFGRRMKDHSGAPYQVPLADGDPVRFSQIASLVDLGDEHFRAAGTVYTPAGPGADYDVHADPATWAALGEDAPVASDRFSAHIERVSGPRGPRYILLQYQLEPDASGGGR